MNKKRFISKWPLAALIVVFALALFPAAGFAQGHGNGRGGGGQMQNRADEGFDRMAAALNLNAQQNSLLDDLKAKTEAFMTQQREKRREIRAAFAAEVGKQKPDMAAAAREIKDNYRKNNVAAFDAMVDATATFIGSLTPEQRQKYQSVRNPGGRGRQGGLSGNCPLTNNAY
jgi:Spy/CpxP family protein refolding chaperone